MQLDASAGRGPRVYCVARPVRLRSLQRISVEFRAAASSKLKAILASLPWGYGAWWKLAPDNERYLRLDSGLGAASGFLLFGRIKSQRGAGM